MVRRFFVAAIFTLLAGSIGFASSASAGQSLRDFREPASVKGPKGWQIWCASVGEACTAQRPETVALDSAALAELAEVRKIVDARIAPRLDPLGLDIWTLEPDDGYGDCEDYALTHRQELVSRGWPRGALDIVFAVAETGEIHAVLAVDTDRGTWILDNRFPEPMHWRDLPYRWIGMEEAGARTWRRLAVRGV